MTEWSQENAFAIKQHISGVLGMPQLYLRFMLLQAANELRLSPRDIPVELFILLRQVLLYII